MANERSIELAAAFRHQKGKSEAEKEYHNKQIGQRAPKIVIQMTKGHFDTIGAMIICETRPMVPAICFWRYFI